MGCGNVAGVRLSDGMFDAQLSHLERTGSTLLKGTASEGKINGVLGAWLRLPNIEFSLRNSLKLDEAM